MSEIQHTQTVQAEMEYLLTKEIYLDWLLNNCYLEADGTLKIINYKPSGLLSLKDYYLRKHGLPLDSEIKGL